MERLGLAFGQGRRRRLTGDECQFLGQPVVQIPGNSPTILPCRRFLELLVGPPVRQRQLDEMAEADQLFDARSGHGRSLDGHAKQALEVSIGNDRYPRGVGDFVVGRAASTPRYC